ncbi:hypothetical protein HRbin29_01575 [bacterium HR29]|mgnify:CR=1 FL=1|jgi:hypothetical protein|nr:hypothetical protein HRbin29_01575 [bacterium HR29]
MLRTTGRIAFSALLLSLFAAFWPGGVRAESPPLSEPEAELEAALHCPASFGSAVRGPVLLVPGTGLTGPENWDWGFAPALVAEGFDVCTVDTKAYGTGDVQLTAERVVFAIRRMYAVTGKPVSVVGYSQGGLNIRWALAFWPDVRAVVRDVVGLAPANGGTDAAAAFCGAGACPAAIWQMVPGSKLLRALAAAGDVFPGPDWTVIYSETDDVVVPPAARSPLPQRPGVQVRNIAVQELCPESQLLHIQFPADGVVFALVLDALLNDGPADPARVPSSVCGTLVPGVTPALAAAKAEELGGLAFQRIAAGEMLTEEPPLAPYAAGLLPSPSPTATPAAPRTGSGRAEGGAGGGAPWALAAAALLLAAACASARLARRSP